MNDSISNKFFHLDSQDNITAIYASRFIITHVNFPCNIMTKKESQHYLLNNRIQPDVIEEEYYHHTDLRGSGGWGVIQNASIINRILCYLFTKTNHPKYLHGILYINWYKNVVGISIKPFIEILGKWRTNNLKSLLLYENYIREIYTRLENKKINSNFVMNTYSVIDKIVKLYSNTDIFLSQKNILENCKEFSDQWINSMDKRCNYKKNDIFVNLYRRSNLSYYALLTTLISLGFPFLYSTIKRVLLSNSCFNLPGIVSWNENINEIVTFDPEASETFHDKRLSDDGAESRIIECSINNKLWVKIMLINIISQIFIENYCCGQCDVKFRLFLNSFFKKKTGNILKIIDEFIENNYLYFVKILNGNNNYIKKEDFLNNIEKFINTISNGISTADYNLIRLYYTHGL